MLPSTRSRRSAARSAICRKIAASITAAVSTQSTAHGGDLPANVATRSAGAQRKVATNITEVNRDADETRTESAKSPAGGPNPVGARAARLSLK